MKPTREDFVAREGTTDGLHGGSGCELTVPHAITGAGDESKLKIDEKLRKESAVKRQRIMDYQDSIAQWLEHTIADRVVPCSNHGGVYLFLMLVYCAEAVHGDWIGWGDCRESAKSSSLRGCISSFRAWVD